LTAGASAQLARCLRGGWPAAILIAAGAAALRLIHIGAVESDPFYDGAVRSMTLSLHNFFFGAMEPAGTVAIDKPPLDLWLQVASVELGGFTSTALKLPEALGGTAAIVLLFAAVRRVFGVGAGLAAALALAVLPVAVITARSDTMDAVMMALLVLALLLIIRAGESGATGWLLGAGAVLGLAFNVKLLESVVALPGLTLLAYLGLPGRRRARLGKLALAGIVYVAVSLSWLTATLAFPAHERPYAFGSSNGSAWNAAFVYNGLERLEGKAQPGGEPPFSSHAHYAEATQAERDRIPITPPSATRLLTRIGPLSGERLGLEAFVALLLGALTLAAVNWGRLPEAWRARTSRAMAALPGAAGGASPSGDGALGAGPEGISGDGGGRRGTAAIAPTFAGVQGGDAERLRRAVMAGLLLWLVTGIALFSHMARLHPRYTEGFTPAVAACLGIGLAWMSTRRTPVRIALLTVTLAAVVIYAERLLFGTTHLWWLTLAGALGALLLTLAGSVARARTPALGAAVLACALTTLLAIPLWASLRAVRENVTDSNPLGVLRASELDPLSSFLLAHRQGARFEVAFDSASKMGALVARDARPVLALTTTKGRVITPISRLRTLIEAREVRYAFLGTFCGPPSERPSAACSAPVLWIRAHGRDISRLAGLRDGTLYLLPGAAPTVGGRGDLTPPPARAARRAKHPGARTHGRKG
jgi:4-amino-4-deoxy-L-arabinose transferase-like glycosyltransferase